MISINITGLGRQFGSGDLLELLLLLTLGVVVAIMGVLVYRCSTSSREGRRMEFILAGRRHNLTREQVEEKMDKVEPELGRQHFVKLKGREYPVKQVLATMLPLSRLDFTTQQARRILARLGFEVIER